MKEGLQYKMLIFEDDPSILSMLYNYFTDLGAEVKTSSDGKGAVEIVKKNNPDIVIMDVVMPVRDGFSIVQDLRDASLHVPVILLTDKTSVDDRVFGLDSGADDYVCKPFSPKELKARVKVLLRRSDREENLTKGAHTFQELSIDPQTREVSIAENQILLTKTEFDLLYFLTSKFPAVTSQEELYKTILGYKPEVETKALVMHVMNLRRKLNDASVTSFEIRAVPSVGYRVILKESRARSDCLCIYCE